MKHSVDFETARVLASRLIEAEREVNTSAELDGAHGRKRQSHRSIQAHAHRDGVTETVSFVAVKRLHGTRYDVWRCVSDAFEKVGPQPRGEALTRATFLAWHEAVNAELRRTVFGFEKDEDPRVSVLVEAYHVAFDIKDEHLDDTTVDGIKSAAYDATTAIADFIERISGTRPRRFDGEGRKDNQ